MEQDRPQPSPLREIGCQHFAESSVKEGLCSLALESVLEIVVNGRAYSLLMHSPGWEKELIVGFLFTEGLIEAAEEIEAIKFGPGPTLLGLAGVRAETVLSNLAPDSPLPDRPVVSLSSSGLSTREVLEKRGRGIKPVQGRQSFSWSTLAGLLQDLPQHQPLYHLTRGVHAAALYRADGTFLSCFEDVGRHNALDKLIGRCLLQNWNFDDKLVVLSGRASLEMILKTVRAGLPLCLCFSSPTVLAVEAAQLFELTLVGRHQEEFLTAYTRLDRLVE